MEKLKEKFSGISAGYIIAFCFSFIAFVYAPLELYLTNIDEFWLKLSEIAVPVVLLFLASFIGCSAVLTAARRTNKNLFYVLVTLMTAAVISLYIQGTFLISNLPPLDGTDIKWNSYTAERIKSALAFAVPAIALIILFIFTREKIIKKIASVGGACLSLLLIVTLVSLMITTDTSKPVARLSTYKNEFLMSKNQNMIILIVDSLDNASFKNEYENDPELREALDGFTYYNNALSGYPFTSRSVPFIFSGKWFENEKPYKDYLADSIVQSPILTELYDRGYATGFYNIIKLDLKNQSDYDMFDNFDPIQVKLLSTKTFKYVFKIGGIKFAPWEIKSRCYNSIGQYATKVVKSETGYDSFWYDNLYFYNSIKDENPITFSDKNCARIIHLRGSHAPYTLTRNAERSKGETTHQETVGGCCTIIKQYIKRLKESGIYDNTAMVILADHGTQIVYPTTDESVVKRFHPTLLVKGIGENHEPKISTAPISYIDLADSFVKLLDGNAGDSIFEYKDGDKRTRRVLVYQYLHENEMYEMETDSTADDYAALTKTGKEFNYKK